jgi:hypothetical protein
MSNSSKNRWRMAQQYIACYASWLGLCALGAYLLLQLRHNLLDVAAYLGATRWSLPAIHHFGVVVLGLLWLGAIFVMEDYLRRGIKHNDLLRRVSKLLFIQVVILACSFALSHLILTRVLG